MATTPEIKPTSEDIADKASRGEDVSDYFTSEFTVVRRAAKAISPENGRSETCPTKATTPAP